jgi:hypothetical protein
MSALAEYEIHGLTSRGRPVAVGMRAIATPTTEVATYILNERYPSATFVSLKRVILKDNKIENVDARKLDVRPIRRARVR